MNHDDLRRRILADHDHLDRTFESLEATLRSAQEGETVEFLEDLTEDLSFAFGEMLEHFGIEEEAIFAQIRDAVPALGPRVDALEQAHEVLCNRTSRLRKLVAAARSGHKPLDVAVCLDLIGETKKLIHTHNRQEIEVFLSALDAMQDVDRRRLLDDLNRL